MTPVEAGWGGGPTEGYDRLADRFRPVFDRIRAGAVERERGRVLPVDPLRWLKEAGFGALRVPVAAGGSGATLPELFALLIELAAADSNLAQALRSHFGFVEEVLTTADAGKRARWLPRVVAGETMGSARSEAGAAKRGAFSTTLRRGLEGDWRLDGAKFYTTGSLYADWLHVAATRVEDGASVTAIVPRHAPGVAVVDDWDGFGQVLTASGTSRFADVRVPDRDVVLDADIFPYTLPFYQTVHLATLAGIGRAAATEAAEAVAARTRTYSHAAASASRADPQVLQVIGQVRGAAYAAGAVALKVAEAVGRVAGDVRAGRPVEASLAAAEVESAQAQTVVSTLVLGATAALFDALGASAVLKSHGLDRHWRNARTITSHNPRIYKDRIVGDFAVNGTPPPQSWRVGET